MSHPWSDHKAAEAHRRQAAQYQAWAWQGMMNAHRTGTLKVIDMVKGRDGVWRASWDHR